MSQQSPEPDGPRHAEDPAAAAAARSGIPLEKPPAGAPGHVPASAGRERDPEDARPHFNTGTGTGEDSPDGARPAD